MGMSSSHKNDLLRIKGEAQDTLNTHVAVFMAELRKDNPRLNFDFWTDEPRIEMYDPCHTFFNGEGYLTDPTLIFVAGHEHRKYPLEVTDRIQKFLTTLNNTLEEYTDNGMFLELNSNYPTDTVTY